MSVIQKTREELQGIHSIQTLSGVMRDLSVSRVQQLRADFQKNLDFYNEIEDFYNKVQNLINEYYAGMAAEMRKRPTANIAITSNHRFYGSLNKEVMDLFVKNFGEADDHIVIGKTGEGYMGSSEHYDKCKFISFEDDNPSRWEMHKIVSLVKSFSRAVVFFPQYRTPFHQEAATMDIVRLVEKKEADPGALSEYIFEPDLPLIHDFFSTQVQFVLVQRIMLETDLSRTATRLVRMDSAESAAADMYQDKKKELRDNIQRQLDIQLFESISGHKKWK
ncbi:MAG: F0F1 ATP synthase subunit gamma [Candidatus Paceibacterota bacterium]